MLVGFRANTRWLCYYPLLADVIPLRWAGGSASSIADGK